MIYTNNNGKYLAFQGSNDTETVFNARTQDAYWGETLKNEDYQVMISSGEWVETKLADLGAATWVDGVLVQE